MRFTGGPCAAAGESVDSLAKLGAAIIESGRRLDDQDPYDALRDTVRTVLGSFQPSLDDINRLHEIAHNAEFRFPPEVCARIKGLIRPVVTLHVYQRDRTGPGLDQEQRDIYASLVTQASNEIIAFEAGMPDLFRPFISI